MDVGKVEIERRSVGAQIYEHIKKMILNKKILGGERIPEEQIARYFNVSRTPIREALKSLEKYGLVRIVPRCYAEVMKLQPDARQRLGVLKMGIDTLAVELCVERITDTQCDHLEAIARQCIRLANKKQKAELFEKDSEFHLKLAEYSGNPVLLQIEQLLDVNVQLLRTTVYNREDSIKTGIEHHLPLVEALRRRDTSAAAELIRGHLADFYFSDGK